MKRADAISLYNLLAAAKLDKVSKETLLATLRNLRALRPTAKEWEETMKEALRQLQGKDSKEVNTVLGEAHAEAMKEEIEISLERLNEDGFAELVGTIEGVSGAGVLLLSDAVGPVPDKTE